MSPVASIGAFPCERLIVASQVREREVLSEDHRGFDVLDERPLANTDSIAAVFSQSTESGT